MNPIVIAVAANARHGVSKQTRPSIRLLAGLGVEGDAHCGAPSGTAPMSGAIRPGRICGRCI